MSLFPVQPLGNPVFADDTSPIPLATITDHYTRMVQRLLWQYQDKPRFLALVSALAAEVQALEAALWGLYNAGLGTATGARLAQWGEIVGAPNPGASDDQYRRLIRAQAAAIRSAGGLADYRALLVAIGATDYKVREQVPLSVSLTQYNQLQIDQADWLRLAIDTARLATVTVVFFYSYTPSVFRFNSSRTGIGGNFAFSSTRTGLGGFPIGGYIGS